MINFSDSRLGCWCRAMMGWLSAAVVLLGNAGPAQALGYSAALTTAYPQQTISVSAPQVVWSSCNSGGAPSAFITCDDGVSTVMPIGFSFTFAGTAYSNWSMSSNGVIFFETASTGNSTGSNAYTPANLPTTSLGNPAKAALMPFWADLQHNASVAGANNVGQPANASFYQYQVVTQPSGANVLVVQLKNVVFWNTNPQLFVNMQVQIWSTGEIVYSYGTLAAVATNPLLRVGLQSAGGTYCHTLANNQTTALSNQSFVYTWDASAPACAALPSVNHYEILHDGSATLCAEPVQVLACSSATAPCPAASIMNNVTVTGSVTVTGVTTVTSSPPSYTLQPSSPKATVNLTWASGSSGTATLGVSSSVTASAAVRCTNVAGTAVYPNCNMTVTNVACIPPPHHYEIQGPASGTNCASQTFTIKAWADPTQTVAYTLGVATGTLTQTGNPASLPSLGAFTIPAGSSTVSVTPITFPATGTTTFSTTATPALAGATTCLFGSSTSCAFAVASCVSDFNCVQAGADSITGRLFTKVSGSAFSFDVVARKADGTTATTYASDADKAVTVELVDGTGATACASRVALSPAVTSQTLTFTKASQPTEQGRKSIAFTVPNAYRDVLCRVTDNATPSIMGCSLNDFAIRPPLATLTTTPAMATPPAANTAATIKAGATFSASAAYSAGTNYSATLTQDTTKLTAQLTTNVATQQPGGTVGTLTPATLISGATGVNATYNEVGYLYLAAGAFFDNTSPAFTAVDSAGGDCIAAFTDTPDASGKVGCGIGTAATTFGRFIPDHFDTAIVASSGPTRPMGCPSGATCPTNASGANGMVYANQPFTITVTARNAVGGTTTNYRDSFAKAATLSAWNARGATGGANANPGGGATANAGVAANTFSNGVASNAIASYGTVLPSVLAAGNVFFRVTENAGGDSVTSLQATPSNSNEAGLYVASARIHIANAYGSEKLPLPMPMTVQYWDGTSWLRSATDSTTSFNSAIVANGGNLTVSQVSGAANCVTVNSPATSAVAAGVRTVSLLATGPCSYNISLSAMPVYLPLATASGGRATFGIFKSPLVYRRENY
jgi:hypothetical protein